MSIEQKIPHFNKHSFELSHCFKIDFDYWHMFKLSVHVMRFFFFAIEQLKLLWIFLANHWCTLSKISTQVAIYHPVKYWGAVCL